MKVLLTVEVTVDEDEAEEVANDFRKMYWNHRAGMHSYKSKTKRIPVSHCTYCNEPLFEKTSNNLCKRQNCITLRELAFRSKRYIELDEWKKMMCDQCSDNNDKAHCYLEDHLVQDSPICKGCIYDTTHPK